jgi:hypothetical protein
MLMVECTEQLMQEFIKCLRVTCKQIFIPEEKLAILAKQNR